VDLFSYSRQTKVGENIHDLAH